MLSELLTPQEMSRADSLTIAGGTESYSLMERAGQAVSNAALDLLKAQGSPQGDVVVLCGPGNNGGDGFIAAVELQKAGCHVRVCLLGSRDALGGDAARAADAWSGPLENPAIVDVSGRGLVIDALFGAGLSRPLDGEAARLTALVNETGRAVLAIDVPSGIDGGTGQAHGPSVKADTTVTFFRAKPGHYLFPGAAQRGTLIVADIGIADTVLQEIAPKTVLDTPALWLDHYPWPANDGHKYKRGHALVVSGASSHTGAARLSARAALRIGAGLVTLASPAEALAENAAQLTAIMLQEAEGANGLAKILSDGRKNAVVLGPGLGVGDATRKRVEAALTTRPEKDEKDGRAVVLDADALTSFEGAATDLQALIVKARGPVVITPHDGEFARLFAKHEDIVTAISKLDKARASARLLGCIVLLKGGDTVIASPDGRTSIAYGEAPWLATAGSGDVLSGLIGGLLAQEMPAFEAANAAAWIHAAAARRFGPGLIAEDLPEGVPMVLADLLAHHEKT